ncbi:DUF4129 domain-containing protein [uncultured Mycobacterium sp.]|uniref:DUF4129 domain-containing protein n=1 Tax=uncultured Mycobacterium sp. TaxID=171292 RepID=UPI0035CB062B
MRDKATGRAVAVIVLLVLVAASLRGYIPEHGRSSRQASSSPLSMVFVIALLTVTLAIMAIALISRLQDPRKRASGAGALPEALGGGIGRPSWRVVLIGLAVLVVWLAIVWTLMRLLAGHGTVQLGPQPPQPSSTPKPHPDSTIPPAPHHDGGGDMFGYLAASAVTLLALLAAGAAFGFRRQRRIAVPFVANEKPPEPAPKGSQSLARAAELGLAEIGDLSREPREAIIACYAAMEGELAHFPGAVPQAFDTPTEVLARAVDHHALHAENAAQLVNLFAEARFSPHVMNESHREVAVHALQLVLTELRSAA